MKITLIGTGCGPGDLTRDALTAIAEAQLVIGARRLLDALRSEIAPSCETIAAALPEEIARTLSESACERACVLLSGDSGFYSAARRLLPLLGGEDLRVLPGISSVQALAARLGRPWQEWELVSAHGVDCDPVSAVCGGRPCFFLTGGRTGPDALCAKLRDAGLGALPVTTGEDLGTERERIRTGTAAAFADTAFSSLSVLLAEAAPRFRCRAPGLPDGSFLRCEGVPMTKQEVRAAALSKLAVGPEDLCWDIGAGTGSVSVELALQARTVWAVERDEEALRLAAKNREKFGAWNLRLVRGDAPEALIDFPKPDAVFVGGSGGRLREILQAVHRANPAARVCVAAVALESLQTACAALFELGYAIDVTQLAVSRSREVGSLHMMLAQNPVYLITGARA
ncbi:MAG: precorrin-6y C5,15-methyltransferase (decarboxylating) subunit CbiE [Oscillospiraceae bacterium]|nr:precorrin-6y C5,15-methyltransferase (decarboxylating) subunit CbiE [Oscillospiraceae bacterium]